MPLSNKGVYSMINAKGGGIEHLIKVLYKARDTLVSAQHNKTIQTDDENEDHIKELMEVRALYRTRKGYRIHPKLSQFVNYFLETETSQYINTQFAERLEEIEQLSKDYLDYKLAQHSKREMESLDILESVVYELITDIEESCQRLRNRIENDFGYGKNLNQKFRENQQAIDQAGKLSDGLKAFTFLRLTEIASENINLNELLCHELAEGISRSQIELTHIIARLRELMMRYRARIQDRDLVSYFNQFLESESSWEFNLDFYMDSNNDDFECAKFNLVTPLVLSSVPDIDDDDSDSELTSITESMLSRSTHERTVKDLGINEPKVVDDEKEVIVEITDNIEQHCDEFLELVVRKQQTISAIAYYEDNKGFDGENTGLLDCEKDIWLFALLSYLQSMLKEKRERIHLDIIGEQSYLSENEKYGYGNLHIEDINVRLRKHVQRTNN